MGDSDKLRLRARYRFVEHREFLDGALAALGVASDVVWVVHEGVRPRARLGEPARSATRGIAYMEASGR